MENRTYNERARFREILSILKKHKIFHGINPEKVRLILEDLGPTYIKLGQIMSMRTDIIPLSFRKELEKLRTEVPPMNKDDLEDVICETYGKNIEEMFDNFSYSPLGSASIAQAHLAYLKGTDTPVILKIQRKGIYRRMEQDIALMKRAAKMVKIVKKDAVVDFDTIIDELWRTAQEEMDFHKEAENAIMFRNNLANTAYVSSPKIYEELTGSKILVMEFIDGFFINELDEMEAMGYDRKEIAFKLADNYITQVIDDGFFHADPHPGNIKIMDGKIVWLDLGMMGRLNPRDKQLLGDLVISVAKRDAGKIKDIALILGQSHKEIDHTRLYSDIDIFLNKYGSMDLGNMSLAGIVSELFDVLNEHHIIVPSNMSMLGRGLMTIEGLLAFLYPEINIIEIVTNHIKNNTDHLSGFSKKIKKVAMDLDGSAEKMAMLPGYAADILLMTAKGQLKSKFQIQIADNEKEFIIKILNRFIIGLIAAAIIIGSSIIVLSDMRHTTFGLPIFSIIGYCISAFLCFILFRQGK